MFKQTATSNKGKPPI